MAIMSNNKPTQNWGVNSPAKASSGEWVNPFFQTHQNLNDEINRIYSQNLEAANKGVKSGGDYVSNDYKNTIDALNQGLQSDITDLTNNSASRGSFGTTAYNEKQNSLASAYNNKAKSAFDTSAYKINNLGLQNQPEIGMQVQNKLPTINQYQASPTGQVGQLNNSFRYNPFQQVVGGLEADKNYAAKKIIY